MRIENPKVSELIQSQNRVVANGSEPTNAFAQILESQLKISGHANTRLKSRDIQIDKEQWERVLNGVERAQSKGAKESLVMVDDIALLVSIKNKTVITAVDKANLKENVFTNIDSAVIV